MSDRSFFAELRRRNIVRAAVFYAGAGWLLVQIATQVFPFFEIPTWVVRVIVVAALIGFPFAMLFSWFYEWTPEGLKRESEIDPSDSVTRQTGKKLDRWIIATLALAVVLLLADKFVLHKPTVASDDKSIAVLPFANTSGDSGNEYFSDGLSEELISSLSRLADLKVIGRTSSFQFKGKTEDSRTIGEALGVAYLLEGSVRKSADRVRIAVALLKSHDGANVWSETYDRELKDIFAVQSEIASAVASQLKVALLGKDANATEVPPVAAPPNRNVEAYNALLQGNFYYYRLSLEDCRKAVGYFEQAIRLDPDYALAYAQLSNAWGRLAATWLSGTEAVDARDKARAAAESALKLDPNLSEAHQAMSFALLIGDFDFVGGEREIRRALELLPTSAIASGSLGTIMAEHGRLAEAQQRLERALELDPLFVALHIELARVQMTQRHYEESDATLRKALELQPGASRVGAHLTIVDLLRGKPEAALEDARREPEGFWRDFAIALAAQAQSDPIAADAALQKFIDEHADGGTYQIADLYAFRKDADRMFEWLDRAYVERDPGILLHLYDPLLLPYQDDPRFLALSEKLRLPHKTGE
ncbi:MAG: tetratricopeptide repeat protein [Rhodanobacteraceae bacterium]